MGHTKSVSRSLLKWTGIVTVAFLLILIGYVVFFLPENVDHTFNLSNKRRLTVYHSANIDFGIERFEGGGENGYRIKTGHLRVRYVQPWRVISGVPF